MDYLKAFLVGGLLCLIGQILIDKTKLTPARILVGYVVAGVVLGAVGVYKPLVEFAGAGASVPLTGFGYNLAKGVKEAVTEKAYTLRKANADMPIADILKLAAPDEAGIWANPQTDPHKMPGADGAASGVSPITSLDQLKTMSPDDINKNWADVQKLLAQQ